MPKFSSARFPLTMRVRLPAEVPAAIEEASRQHMTSSSEYIRRSILERLKKDGIDLGALFK